MYTELPFVMENLAIIMTNRLPAIYLRSELAYLITNFDLNQNVIRHK